MTDWKKFSDRFDMLRPALEAWGQFVHDTIQEKAKEKFSEATSLQMSSMRPKEKQSALEKIGRKSYSNPIVELTDLVGVRFVTLLSSDLDVISEIIETEEIWTYSLDRDEEQEKADAPNVFDYQSRHYVVKAKSEIEINGVTIPAELPCEIQLRTILQHAFAEVTHDKVYKPSGEVPIKAKRFVSSSMALMETADHLMCETMRLINQENEGLKQALSALSRAYDGLNQANASRGYDEKLNLYVIDALKDHIGQNLEEDISQLLREKHFIVDNVIKHSQGDNPFWRQPIALLAYLAVSRSPRRLFIDWPLANFADDIEIIYAELGERVPH